MESNQKYKEQKLNSDDILDLDSVYNPSDLEIAYDFWINMLSLKRIYHHVSYHELSLLTGYSEEALKQILKGEIKCLKFTYDCIYRAIYKAARARLYRIEMERRNACSQESV